MNSVLVIVTDGARARFFTLEYRETPTGEERAYLLEREDLLNPERGLSGRELWSEAESQAGHYREGKGPAHSYDDRRRDHEVEWERHFARSIAERTLQQIRISPVRSLLLASEPRFLGVLREVFVTALPENLPVVEWDKDLCHLKPLELQAYLTERELL
jgi:protein required for attachment to host cells